MALRLEQRKGKGKHVHREGLLTGLSISPRALGLKSYGIPADLLGVHLKVFQTKGPRTHMLKFKESLLAHKLLDGLEGIEIGGSAHNPFGLKTRNVDYTDKMDTVFKKAEIEMCGEALPVDIVAPGDDLPLEDSSVDFVINSHVMEHFPDPIKALKEWHRVVRPGGFIFVVAPNKNRIFDKDRERTTLAELIERHKTGKCPYNPDAEHCSFWITEDFVELINWLKWPIVAIQDVDDKVSNGFTVVILVEKSSVSKEERRVVKMRGRSLSPARLLSPTPLRLRRTWRSQLSLPSPTSSMLTRLPPGAQIGACR